MVGGGACKSTVSFWFGSERKCLISTYVSSSTVLDTGRPNLCSCLIQFPILRLELCLVVGKEEVRKAMSMLNAHGETYFGDAGRPRGSFGCARCA